MFSLNDLVNVLFMDRKEFKRKSTYLIGVQSKRLGVALLIYGIIEVVFLEPFVRERTSTFQYKVNGANCKHHHQKCANC